MRLKGILIDSGEAPVLYSLADTEQGLAAFVGGPLKRKPIRGQFAALLYTDTIQGLPTRHYDGRWYYGRLLIVGWRKGRPRSLTRVEQETLLRQWDRVEVQYHV